MKHYLGMDIGGTKCAVVLGEKKGNGVSIKNKIVFDTNSEKGWEKVVDRLISCAKKLADDEGVVFSDILSCGVSCGGPLDSETGIIMSPPNLPGWDNVPLVDIIRRELGVPCKLENDADACALAEWQFGAGRGSKNMIFLTFGTGMGAGLIIDGKLYSGTCGTAGEVGHIRIDSDGPAGYGKAGSFEGYCSGGGIANLGKRMIKFYSGDTSLDSSDMSAKSIAEAARNGDALALAIYKKSGEMLGRGLSVLIDILNPEKIIIGSIFQRSGELMVQSMRETLNKEALPVALSVCQIIPSLLGDEIGDYAALGVAKESAEAK
ncbi:MAG: ROK family protein [Clostridia bacterium]|nr:ROK family protein [Clostridia bacterium]